ncbi:MAG: DNA/RNA nuclease SfsA [Alphaproteobacteria bacterium GM202ARS2]|nr:DNA/RNA nuclease SfsA [Alphaproteobacteria bacterium GM202ARS2]
MQFRDPLIPGHLLQRYKRFLADVNINIHEKPQQITAHCPNPGSMLGVAEPNSTIWLSRQHNPKSKLAWQWQLTETQHSLVGINTLNANAIVADALARQTLEPFAHYPTLKREVSLKSPTKKPTDTPTETPTETMRVDFVLSNGNTPPCYLEVKNVTMRAPTPQAYASFPDSITTRGQRHMRVLADMAEQGLNTAVLFVVQRSDCQAFCPADAIDAKYGEALRHAHRCGTQIYAYDCQLSPQSITLRNALPILL